MFKSLLFSLLTVTLVLAVLYFNAVSVHRVVGLAFSPSIASKAEVFDHIEREVRKHATRR